MDTEEQEDKQVRLSARDTLERVCGIEKVLSCCMQWILEYANTVVPRV